MRVVFSPPYRHSFPQEKLKTREAGGYVISDGNSATRLAIHPGDDICVATILCAEELSKGNDILVAYDGSLPSMRAVQIFALLGMATDRHVHVTSIEAGQELAVRKACGAAAYLESHGFLVEADPIASSAAPAEVIRAEAADRKIATIVMGAYGHRGWREFLFGSTTRRLTEAPPCALFIYH